jgi:hypothetical protein
MSLRGRLERLADLFAPPQGTVRIRVYRVPPDIPEEDVDRWCKEHPEAVSKTVDVPAT